MSLIYENKKPTVAAVGCENNILLKGKAVNPSEFKRILDNAPVVSEIGKPEPIKCAFSSKEDDGGQY